MPDNAKPQPADPAPLARKLAARIGREGPLTLAAYMEAALCDPEHGYYTTREAVGADFTTAPEISQMFGEIVGAWLADMWARQGSPAEVNLVELGPGRGTLAADILRVFSLAGIAAKVHLVEVSPLLREKQAATLSLSPARVAGGGRGRGPAEGRVGEGAETLEETNTGRCLLPHPPHPSRADGAGPFPLPPAARGEREIKWHGRLEDVPKGFSLIVANEFFDALPVHQFEKTKAGWMERRVGADFAFTLVPPGFDIAGIMPPAFMEAEEGGVFEICPAGLSVMEEIARRVGAHGGAALVIDYGHASPGLGDTVQALTRGGYSAVLEAPGTKDITAHVDFGTLKTVAAQHAAVHGPAEQGRFLAALGIEARAEKLAQKAGQRDIALALHRLTAPSEMGRLFKVMGILPGGFGDNVPGF